jgi:hypothetical protein
MKASTIGQRVALMLVVVDAGIDLRFDVTGQEGAFQ